MQNLKKLLKQHLEENNISLHAFEKKAHLGRGFLTRLFNEYDHVPSLENVIKIADELHYSLDLLLDRHKYLYSGQYESNTDKESPITIELSLVDEIFAYIKSFVKHHNIQNLNFEIFWHTIKEIYIYSHPRKKLDTKFAEWLLNNKFNPRN